MQCVDMPVHKVAVTDSEWSLNYQNQFFIYLFQSPTRIQPTSPMGFLNTKDCKQAATKCHLYSGIAHLALIILCRELN